MAEISTGLLELSKEDVPICRVSGTPKRRIKLYVRANALTVGDTLTIPDHVASVEYIESVESDVDTGAFGATGGTAINWTGGRNTGGTATWAGTGGTAETTFVCVLK